MMRYLLLFILCIFSLVNNSLADHSDSVADHVTWMAQKSFSRTDDCFSTGKVIWNSSEVNSTYMPTALGTVEQIPTSSGSTIIAGTALANTLVLGAAGVGVSIATSLLTGGITLLIAAAIVGIQMGIMMDACTNFHIVAPHEYYNRAAGKQCVSDGNGGWGWPAGAYTKEQIPYFFHCDPNYNPLAKQWWQGAALSPSTNAADAKLVGRTYGYGGATFCTTSNMTLINGGPSKPTDLVGGIFVEYGLNGQTDPKKACNSPGNIKFFRPSVDNTYWNSSKYIYPTYLWAYYKIMPNTNEIRLCAAALSTLFPVWVACGNVAPPGDALPVDDYLLKYASGTRCLYLAYNRDDLNSLGDKLSATDDVGATRTSVKNFLKSDLHLTSTVVGCLKDMLIRIFITPTDKNSGVNESYFVTVQKRLKQIVLAVLVLYVSLVGLKLITNPEPPKRNEVIMMVLKFALVFYVAVGDLFYSTDPSTGQSTGLFPQLLQVTDELSSFFLQAQNAGDPLGMCTYMYKGSNLLGEATYSGGGVTPTEGYTYVKLSVWDLVDCKLLSYLNFGSCHYNLPDLMGAWLFSVAFFITGVGFIFAVVSFAYCFMLLLVIFKYTHITLMAFIVVTILIFLSPIFVLFALFEVTKGIFEKWFKLLLGYLIYPALLFAFMSIMLATLDTIYYGFTVTDNTKPVDIATQCKNVDSIYCNIMAQVPEATNSNDLCNYSQGFLAKKFVTGKTDLGIFGSYWTATTTISSLWTSLLKLLLFCFLFYLFMSSVSQFMSALLQISDLGGQSIGSVNALNILKKASPGKNK